MKSIIPKISIVLFGFFLAFIMGEAVLRWLGYAASDIYTQEQGGLLILNPNKNIHVRGDCFQNDVKTNSYGFHSREYSLEKPEGVFRIVIIGDSFVEAMQVPRDKTFTALLEQKLNSLDSNSYKYEVIPFGISSHGTYKSILYFENYAVEFKPDLVIAAFSLNDTQDDAFESDFYFDQDDRLVKNISITPLRGISKSVKKILRKSVLITTLRKSYLTAISNPKKNSDKLPAEVEILLPEYNNFWQEAWVRQEELLKKFKETAATNNADFILVSLTDGYRVHQDLLEKFQVVAQGYPIELGKPEKLLSRIAQENRFPYLALNPLFKERAQKEEGKSVWPCDGHWNELGHQWAADAIFYFLVLQKLTSN